jgi:hypothetical protein
MIAIKFSNKDFVQDMNNVINYSTGFIEGANRNKFRLMNRLGKDIVERLKQFIDANARLSPERLHHVYEWHKAGSPDARLYDITYRSTAKGLSFNYTFSQSISLQRGSSTPFYNKAKIMEEGLPVTISPVSRKALRFTVNGEEVFSKGTITVNNPGGEETTRGLENTINSFFNNFFTQSYLRASGMIAHLETLKSFRDNLKKGAGKQAGINAGARWVIGQGEVLDVQR